MRRCRRGSSGAGHPRGGRRRSRRPVVDRSPAARAGPGRRLPARRGDARGGDGRRSAMAAAGSRRATRTAGPDPRGWVDDRHRGARCTRLCTRSAAVAGSVGWSRPNTGRNASPSGCQGSVAPYGSPRHPQDPSRSPSHGQAVQLDREPGLAQARLSRHHHKLRPRLLGTPVEDLHQRVELGAAPHHPRGEAHLGGSTGRVATAARPRRPAPGWTCLGARTAAGSRSRSHPPRHCACVHRRAPRPALPLRRAGGRC